MVLAGQSAGAMCWFEWGVTRSAGDRPPRARASGSIPGVLSVHYHRDADRRQTLLDRGRAARATAATGSTTAPALLFRGTEIGDRGQRHDEEAAVWRVVPDGRAARARDADELDGAARHRRGRRSTRSRDEVFELRAVRALRSRRL